MADSRTSGTSNAWLYGIIGALAAVVLGGGLYVFNTRELPVALPVAPAVEPVKPAPPAPPSAPVAAPKPPPPPAPAAPAGPSATQIGQARNLIAEARRFASLGNFAEAELALQNAEKAASGSPEIASGVAAARRDIADMRTSRGQLGQLVERTRRAIERGDFPAAERTLAEAERIDADAPAVVEVRRELRRAARGNPDPQDGRVAVLLAAARAAIAVGNLAVADQAIRQAEQLDPRDPAVVQARADFRAAERSTRPPRN